MTEDILKFRTICGILRKEGYLNKQLCLETGITHPTLKKILKGDIQKIKIYASVKGLIQDFNKKHIELLNYAGAKHRKRIDKGSVEFISKCNSDYTAENIKPGENETPAEMDKDPETEKPGLPELVSAIQKFIPKGATLNISGI